MLVEVPAAARAPLPGGVPGGTPAALEVRARAKILALRGQHDGPARGMLVQGLVGVRDRVDEVHVEEIVGRALDLDDRDVALFQRDPEVLEAPDAAHPRFLSCAVFLD